MSYPQIIRAARRRIRSCEFLSPQPTGNPGAIIDHANLRGPGYRRRAGPDRRREGIIGENGLPSAQKPPERTPLRPNDGPNR